MTCHCCPRLGTLRSYPGRVIDHDEMPDIEGPADPWSALLPGQELVPAYLTSRVAAQYGVIVGVLLPRQDTSLTRLPYDEVAAWVHTRLATQVPAETSSAADCRCCSVGFAANNRPKILANGGTLSEYNRPQAPVRQS